MDAARLSYRGRWAAATALAVVALAGCAASPPRVVVQKVDVPVPVQTPCPAPSAPARPHLPIADLAPGAPPAAVDRALVATVATLQGYAAQLEQLLGATRSP